MHGSDRVGILAPPAGAGGALLGRPQVPGVLYWDAREPLAGAGGAVRADGARHNGLYYYRTYYYRSQVLGVLCVPTEHVIMDYITTARRCWGCCACRRSTSSTPSPSPSAPSAGSCTRCTRQGRPGADTESRRRKHLRRGTRCTRHVIDKAACYSTMLWPVESSSLNLERGLGVTRPLRVSP